MWYEREPPKTFEEQMKRLHDDGVYEDICKRLYPEIKHYGCVISKDLEDAAKALLEPLSRFGDDTSEIVYSCMIEDMQDKAENEISYEPTYFVS